MDTYTIAKYYASHYIDVFAELAVSATAAVATAQQKVLAPAPANAMEAFRASPQWQQRVQENLARSLQWRRPQGGEGQGMP